MIRFISENDISRLVELCSDHAAYEKADYSPLGKETLLRIDLFSDHPKLYCLVAEIDGRIVGFTTYMIQYATWDATDYIYMDCLFIEEKARGKGLGEDLVNRIKLEAKALGCHHIQWQTPDFNTRAIKFYDRIGAVSKSKERFFLNVD